MFVKSKSGELDRRVNQCEKIINSIAEKDEQRQKKFDAAADGSATTTESDASNTYSQNTNNNNHDNNDTGDSNTLNPNNHNNTDTQKTTTSFHKPHRKKSRQKLVYLLRQEILQLTRDVQRLARFIGVQRTGFRKLLKKYTKWSQSSQLSDMFLPILESPNSFTNQDFTSVFLELSLLYNVLRQAKGANFVSRRAPSQYPTNSETLCRFDCEMVTAAVGTGTGTGIGTKTVTSAVISTNPEDALASNSLVFWVHPDNVVEIKVALLKSLGLVSDDSATGASLSKSGLFTSIDNNNNKNKPGSPINTINANANIHPNINTHSRTSSTASGNLSKLDQHALNNKIVDSIPKLHDEATNKEFSKDLSFAIYLDNPKKFNSIQTHSEPGQIRWIHSQPKSPEAQKNQSQNENQNQTSSHVLCSPVGGLRHFCLASLSPSQADLILHAHFDGLSKEISAEENNLSKLALSWVERRKAVPISKASFNRTRFKYIGSKHQPTSSSPSSVSKGTGGISTRSGTGTGTGGRVEVSEAPTLLEQARDQNSNNIFSTSPVANLNAVDLWATLDTNIRIIKANQKDPSTVSFDPIDTNSFSSSDSNDHIIDFPYAVLQVRYKGMSKPLWLAELEESHLVYPVDNFSLYAHSVATFYAKKLSQLPSWLSVLNDNVDIRKTPEKKPVNANITNNNNSTNVTNNNTNNNNCNDFNNNSSNTPTSGILLNNSSTERYPLLSSATSYFPNYITSSSDISQQYYTQDSHQPIVRYWNEFDDPEDGPADDGVFVIISDDEDEDENHNANSVFSDHNVIRLMRLSDRVVKRAHTLKDKLAEFFGFGSSARHQRRDCYGRSCESRFRYNNNNNNDNGYDNYHDDDSAMYEDDDSYHSYDEDSDEYYYYNSRCGLPTIYEEIEDDMNYHGQGRGWSRDRSSSSSSSSFGAAARDVERDLDYYNFPSASFSLLSSSYPYESTVAKQRDSLLTIVYAFLFLLSLMVTVIVASLVLGSNVGSVLNKPLLAALAFGLAVSLSISLLAIYLYFLRTRTPGIWHQLIVYTLFSGIMSFSIGGIVWIIL